MQGMLYFLLVLIAAWVLWKIARYEIGRWRRARELHESLRPAAGVLMRGEELEQWKRAQERARDEHEERMRQILSSTPWLQRGAMRRHLERKTQLGYKI